MRNERIVKPSAPLFGGQARPSEPSKPRAAITHENPPKRPPDASAEQADESPKPKPKGVRRARYNLTVRLSPDERERLEIIGRHVGRPDPLTLAETVRWLIGQWTPL